MGKLDSTCTAPPVSAVVAPEVLGGADLPRAEDPRRQVERLLV
jgi:hypothetical protein